MPSWFDLPLNWLTGIATDWPAPILAYLDPGTGSFALQILLATFFGGVFALKQSWSNLKLWLSRRFETSPPTADSRSVRNTPSPGSPDNARPTVHGHQTAKIR